MFSILLFLFLANFGFADQPKLTIEVAAHSAYWLRLLHYKHSLIGDFKSQIDNKGFFLAQDGNINPTLELEATINAFRENKKVGPLEQPARCAFPARWDFVQKFFKQDFPNQKCDALEEWKDALKANSASLIFSSSYPNTPASLFGHTFLRLNSARKNDPSKKLDILDYGINFAAATQQDPGVIYAWKGLFGGYDGVFSLAPYYTKLNEYVFSESRDIWEYELDLNAEQINRLTNHLWELMHGSYFRYFYLDENCSYQILSLLEVARPDWVLTDFLGYVIPLDTLKKVVKWKKDIKVNYRPSLRKQLVRTIKKLSSEENKEFKEVVFQDKPLPQDRGKDFYDSINQYLLFKKNQSKNILSPKDSSLYRDSLVRRSKLGTGISSSETYTENATDFTNRPDKGHHAYRLGTSFGSNFNESFQELGFRFAVHDLLSPSQGYIQYSQVEGGYAKVRHYNESGKFALEQIDILSIVSLFPKNFIEHPLSWKMSTKVQRLPDLGCVQCLSFHFDGGFGYAWNFPEEIIKDSIFYIILAGSFDYASKLKPIRAGVYPETFVLLAPFKNLKTSMKYTFKSDLLGKKNEYFTERYRHNLQADIAYFLSASFDLRSSFQLETPVNKRGFQKSAQTKELLFSLNYYF